MSAHESREILAASVGRLRAEREWTGRKLAAEMTLLGFAWTPATVSAVEHGTRSVSVPEMVALCDAFGVNLPDILPLPAKARKRRRSDDERAASIEDAIRSQKLEQHVARSLGVSEEWVRDAADVLFERTLYAERNKRAALDSNRDERGALGHITRGLVYELRDYLAIEGSNGID